MQKQVAILHQGFIPLYRVKFYELLNKISGIKYVVYHGDPPSLTGHRAFRGNPDFPNVRIRNREFSLFGKKILYQPVVTKIILGSFDAVVLGHEPRIISNLVLFTLCKAFRKPVIWWGQGFEKAEMHGIAGQFISQLIAAFKRILARQGNMFVVYTEGGARKLSDAGVPEDKIKVVRNTLDMEEQRALYGDLIDRDPLELRRMLNLRLDSKILLNVGRLYKDKRVDELLYLVKRINEGRLCSSFVEAVIIGNGPDLERLKQIGEKIEGVHFTGEIYEQELVARYMRVSSAVVMPARVGLVVNHAFSQGVPVITRYDRSHGPEVEYIIDGTNGLVIGGDFDSFVEKIANYLNLPEWQKILAKGALETSDSLTLDFMINAFDQAVIGAMRQSVEGAECPIEPTVR